LTGNTIRGWAVTASGQISRYHEIITGIANNNNQVPKDFSLRQNYPNPFNPTTKIAYQLPKAGNVKLTVYDLLGREVHVLVNEFKQAGNYSVDFNASNYASGIYFYRIEAGDFKDVKKMVLVK
jgi:Tol biopolymer transport system component